MIYRILLMSLFFNSFAFASFEAWKEQARIKYGMTEAQIATCAPEITSQESWDEYRLKHFHVPVVYPDRDAVKKAFEEQIVKIDAQILACQQDCRRIEEVIAELWSTPDSHPSGLDLKRYEETVIEVTTGKLMLSQEALLQEGASYNLPQSIYPQEQKRRIIISQQIHRERIVLSNSQGPISQFWRIARLDMLFGAIAQNILTELVPHLFDAGVAGPYVTQCAGVWESFQNRGKALRDFILFGFKLENELGRWLYNALDREGAVTLDDYNYLKDFWGYRVEGNIIEHTGSGIYMEKLRAFFLARQGVLLRELYLRGFQPRDFDEHLHGEVVEDNLCYINIIPLLNHYMFDARQHTGMFFWKHPDHMRRSMQMLLTVNIPRRVSEALIQIDADDQETSEHNEDELKKEFIDQLRSQMIQLTSQCGLILEKQKAVLNKLLAASTPSKEQLDFLMGPKGTALITNLGSIQEAASTLSMIETKQMLSDASEEIRKTFYSFFSTITQALKTDEDLVTLKEWFNQRLIFLNQMMLLSHMTAIEEVLGDTFLTVQFVNSPYYRRTVDEEDKEMFFQLLDQTERYIPGLINYLKRFSENLDKALR